MSFGISTFKDRSINEISYFKIMYVYLLKTLLQYSEFNEKLRNAIAYRNLYLYINITYVHNMKNSKQQYSLRKQ